MAARIGTIRIKPVTLTLQTRGFIGQQLLLPVQFVQIVLGADGHAGFRYDITNYFTVQPLPAFCTVTARCTHAYSTRRVEAPHH